MMNQYSIKYFIKKFEAIPEEKWCKGTRYGYNGASCATSHAGGFKPQKTMELTDEALAFAKIIDPSITDGVCNSLHSPYETIYQLNDGLYWHLIEGDERTPKQRVLDFLYAKLRTGATIK